MDYLDQRTRSRRFTVTSNREINIRVDGDDEPVEQSITIRCRNGIMHTPVLYKGKFIDMSSLEGMARDIVKGKKTDRARVEAILDFCRADNIWHWFPPLDYKNVVKLVNSYGYGYCVIHAHLFHELCSAIGLKSTKLEFFRGSRTDRPIEYGKEDHSLNEVYYEGGWHLYDSYCDSYYEDEKGNPVSVTELKKRPELLDTSADAYGLSPVGSPVACHKWVYPRVSVARFPDVVGNLYTANFSLMPGSSIRLDLKPMEKLVDAARLLPPWKMEARPVFNTGRILLKFRKQDIDENILRVRVPYVVLSAHLSESLVKCFKNIHVSESGEAWRPVRAGIVRFETDPMEYYLMLEDQKRPLGSACTIENYVQFNSISVPFLRRGINRIFFRTKGKAPFEGELIFRWRERSVKKTYRKKQKSIKWSKEIALCDRRQTQSRGVSATIDPSGTIWTAFQVKRGGRYAIRYGYLSENDRCFEEVGTGKGFYGDFPDILVDSSGGKHLVFQTGTAIEDSNIIYVNLDRQRKLIKVNGEDSWRFSWFPKLAACKNQVVVTWQGPEMLKGQKTFDGGASVWVKTLAGKGRTLRYDGYYQRLCLPAIAADSRGRFHLVFVYQGVDYREVSSDLSSTLSSASIFPYHCNYGFGADIATDGQNDVYAVWSARVYGTKPNIYLRKRKAGKWGKCTRISERDFSDSKYPSIAVGPDGQIHMVWMDNRSGKWAIFYKRFDGKRWFPDCPISNFGKDAMSPKVIVGKDNKPTIFWHYSHRGRNHAFCRTEF